MTNYEEQRARRNPVLQVSDLHTHIRLRDKDIRAVSGISFHVDSGETLGLVGESGCGKTMTGMSIMRLLPKGGAITQGEIRFASDDAGEVIDLAKASSATMRRVRGKEIGMVFQDPMSSLNPTMTIGRQVAEPVLLHREVTKKEAHERTVEVLNLVGLPRPAERLDDYPHQLSGGMRQRVMIAMALVCEPKLLIADEPTTALDVTIQAQILALLDELKERLGMAMILVTHDMGVIASRADRVVVMYGGQKAESASTEALFTSVRHPYTGALLASIPQLDQDPSERLYSIAGMPPDLSEPQSGCTFAPRCEFVTERCLSERPVSKPAAHEFACFNPLTGSAEDLIEAFQKSSTEDAPATERSRIDVVPAAAHAAAAGNEVPLLEFRNVSREFAVGSTGVLSRKQRTLQAVSDVSIALNWGETLGLVGESGCGKTTLGRIGVGLEVATRGEVMLNGVSLKSLSRREMRERRRDLQLMFQDPYASLDPRMRAQEIISEPLRVARIGNKTSRDTLVQKALDEVGLHQAARDRYPHEFSGGQRQRIGLARALVLNPKVIVADEPVSALDVSVRSQILNLMKDVQREHGIGFVVISHDLSVIRYISDRIGVMYLGKLVEIGTGDDIYMRTAHPYTAGLLESIPIARVGVREHREVPAVTGELPSAFDPPSGCRFRTRCPMAQDVCAAVEPPMRSFGGNHLAACHFPLQKPVTASENSVGEQPQTTVSTHVSNAFQGAETES